MKHVRVFSSKEAVPQLILTVKITLLFGFKALFVFLFLAFLDCWTTSKNLKMGACHPIRLSAL
jgi:hypothetical protein